MKNEVEVKRLGVRWTLWRNNQQCLETDYKLYMREKKKSKLGSNFQDWGTGRIYLLLLERSH